MVDEKTGELKLSKVTKMRVTRIALCKKPAVPEAEFVLVKSVDLDDQLLEKTTDVDASSGSTGLQDTNDGVKIDHASSTGGDQPVVAGDEKAETTKLTTEQLIAKAVEEAVAAKLSKMPQLAGMGNPGWTFVDGEEAAAIQKSITELVQTCNESTMVPRGVKALVGQIAKYHGVEGPDVSDETVFSEFVAQMKALLPVMQQMVVAMAKAQPPAPAAPAAPAPKPAATAKSVDTIKEAETTEGEDEGDDAADKTKRKSKKKDDSGDDDETGSSESGAADAFKKDCSSAEMKVKKEQAPPELVAQLAHKQHEIEVLKKAVEQLTRETTKALGRDPDYRQKLREKTKAA